MKQMSVAASEYIKKPKQTRKEQFLQEMEAVAGVDTLPDETTILNFRHRLERYGLSKQVFAEVNGLLTEQGLLLREGTTVDATLIAAPPSTKNREGKRDPAMTQTKKGNQWYFGMKAHIGFPEESLELMKRTISERRPH